MAAEHDLTAEIHSRMQDGVKCPYRNGDRGANPHTSKPLRPEPKILSSVLEHIGNTPLVRVDRLCKADGVEAEVLAKCEFFNAGGSVKDRIGLRMVEDAEKQGRIKPGDTLIEPTSGNTGIGLALAAAVKGYRMIITMPEKMSQEKVDVLKALGAEVVRTPTSAAWDAAESHVAVALRLEKELPNAHILDQYSNPSNPMAHYEWTAEELIDQCDGKIDAVVMSAGTGGTITGVARKLKEKIPGIHVVGVDPHGSILAQPASLNTDPVSYQVEGIGYDFIPKVLDRQFVDEWVKSSDKESFTMARRMIREEGLLCGGSSGATMHHAMQVAKRLGKGKRVVVLLADSIRNYMTKHLNVGWMVEHGFMEPENETAGSKSQFLSQFKVQDLELAAPVTVQQNVTVEECIAILNKYSFDQLPVTTESGAVLGVVTMTNLTSQLLSGKTKAKSPVSEVTYKQYSSVGPTAALDDVARKLEKDHFVVVVVNTKDATGAEEVVERSTVVGVVTQIDVLNFMVANGNGSSN